MYAVFYCRGGARLTPQRGHVLRQRRAEAPQVVCIVELQRAAVKRMACYRV